MSSTKRSSRWETNRSTPTTRQGARWRTWEIKELSPETYIRSHRGEFIGLSAKRVARFWTGAGLTVNSGVVELHAVLTSLLGLAGLAALFQRRREVAMLFLLPLLVFPLPYYITHTEFRFRVVLDPLLTILGAYAITRVSSYWQTTRGA